MRQQTDAESEPKRLAPGESPYRIAPPGFTSEQREFFDREGYLILPERLSDDETAVSPL